MFISFKCLSALMMILVVIDAYKYAKGTNTSDEYY